MTQMLVKPASSAAGAIDARRGPISSAPPGHVKREICRPNSNGTGCSFCRRADSRRGDERAAGRARRRPARTPQ